MSHHLYVRGLLSSSEYHYCTELSNQLKSAGRVTEVSTLGEFEFSWNAYVQQEKREWREEAWSFKDSCVVLLNGQFLGGHSQLFTWAQEKFNHTFDREVKSYESEARESYLKYLSDVSKKFVYLELASEGATLGKLVFELDTRLCPKSSKNFLQLCTGAAGKKGDVTLSFVGSPMHRMLPGGWIQGGDIVDGGGTNSICVFDGEVFEDESFAVPHDRRGVLGYANKGPHTNGSQFYITFQTAKWMDKNYVAFGQLVEGTELLVNLESVATFNQRPKKDIKVSKSGIYSGN
ncbi:Peptidyl-prolyl cis-trans isomerase-like 6 [Oopsacas minuta]|uniref:Peptidyl-prolyl cis-trans isomerase n=1 Tax=Oopsacas minuta TaxID=111878 RepID=A0AAV7JM23_9METZ|nr:Peptidyl-prolyl cis-trans isomerase-like 6 [Oopsacas minuta]